MSRFDMVGAKGPLRQIRVTVEEYGKLVLVRKFIDIDDGSGVTNCFNLLKA